MKAEPLRARIVEVLNGWLQQEGFAPLDAAHVLDAPDLDHAVARGAADYGRVRASGRGVRIRSGALAQLLHRHRERAAGRARLSRAAQGALRRAVRDGGRARARRSPAASSDWRSASRRNSGSSRSTIRKGDRPGAIIEDWGDDLEELGPLEVTLAADGRTADGRRRVVPVTLESRVTEIGTLELWCKARDGDASVEAGAEHPRGRDPSVNMRVSHSVSDRHRSRHHQLRRRRRGHARGAIRGPRCSAFPS